MRVQSFLLASSVSGIAVAVPQLSPRQAGSGATFTVTLSKTYQTVDGFGISGAFQRANLIVNLTPEKQKTVLDLLFSNTTGAAFSIVRNGIGSSPDSSKDYMNTILPKNPGSPSAKPDYVWDGKDSGQLWLSQQAQKYGVNTFYANAWSAPGFMKTNGQDANGGTLCGVSGATCSSGDWRQAYADYLVQYVKFYQQEGINVTHLGFLNEPDMTTAYASMRSTGQQAADFIKVLSKTLKDNNLGHIGINCCDSTGWQIAGQVAGQIKSSGAEDLLYAITSHEYTSRLGAPLSTKAKVWETEYCDLTGQWTAAWYANGGAGEGWSWAMNVYNALTRSNVNAYLYWEAVQQTAINGNVNEKLIKIDNGNYEVSKRLWAFAQWSRFVRPGAVRVGTSGQGVTTSAFKNVDGSLAVQVLNSGSAQTVSFTTEGFNATKVTAWLTDNKNDLVSTPATLGTDGAVSGSVPSRAMVTFLLS